MTLGRESPKVFSSTRAPIAGAIQAKTYDRHAHPPEGNCMDISSENKSDLGRSDHFSAAGNALRIIIGWLIGIFSLTESERIKAGIHIRRQGT